MGTSVSVTDIIEVVSVGVTFPNMFVGGEQLVLKDKSSPIRNKI
jgi:hypothetical protein